MQTVIENELKLYNLRTRVTVGPPMKHYKNDVLQKGQYARHLFVNLPCIFEIIVIPRNI